VEANAMKSVKLWAERASQKASPQHEVRELVQVVAL
jgi:hypothetical protein